MKVLSRLRLKFTHLNEHKFRHGFNDTVNPICPCGAKVDTTELFLQRYSLDSSFLKLNTKNKVAYLLYGSTSNSKSLNKDITAEHAIKFLKSSGPFNKLLLLDK